MYKGDKNRDAINNTCRLSLMKHMVDKRRSKEQIILKLAPSRIKRRLNRLQFVRRKNRRRGEIRCDGSKATAHVAFSRNDPQVLTSNRPQY